MKKLLIGLYVSLSLNTLNAADKEFMDFLLKHVEKRNFTQCNNGIKTTFDTIAGSDISVNSEWFDETKKDSLRISVIYGSKGDSVFQEAGFRRIKNQCFITKTSILTTEKSCIAYAKEMKAFDYDSEVLDYIKTKNKGGVAMILKDLNNGCMVVFQNSDISDENAK